MSSREFLNPYCFHHLILHQVTTTRCPQLCEDRLARVNRLVGGLPLCGLVMLRCLNSTKIQRRWQCRAQCSGPCLRAAPVPLTPASLGQPSAVFRSVCSTRDHANLWLLCDCYYALLYCSWLILKLHQFSCYKIEKSLNWTNVPQQSNAVSVTMNLLRCVACRIVTSAARTRQCCLGGQTTTTTRDRHETSHFLHKRPAPSQLWVRHLSAIFLCRWGAVQNHDRAIPDCSPCFLRVKHAGKAAAGRGK